MDYNLFKDWIKKENKKIMKKLITDIQNNSIPLYNYSDKLLQTSFQNYLEQQEIPKLNFEGVDYYDYHNDLKLVPFDMYNIQIVESFTVEYDQDWFTIYRDKKAYPTILSDLVLIERKKLNQILDWYDACVFSLYNKFESEYGHLKYVGIDLDFDDFRETFDFIRIERKVI